MAENEETQKKPLSIHVTMFTDNDTPAGEYPRVGFLVDRNEPQVNPCMGSGGCAGSGSCIGSKCKRVHVHTESYDDAEVHFAVLFPLDEESAEHPSPE